MKQYYNLTITQRDIIERTNIYNDINYILDKYKEETTTEYEKDLYNYLFKSKLEELE